MHNKKQNVIKKRWLKNFNEELENLFYKKVNGVWTKGDLISTPDTNDWYFATDSYIDDNYAYFTSRHRLYIYTNNNGTLTHLGNTWADSSLFNNGAVMGKKSDGSYYSSTFCHIEVFGDSFLFVRYQNSATATGQVNEIHYFKRNSGQNVWVKQTNPSSASHPFKNIYSYTEGSYPSMTLNNDYIVIGDRIHSTGDGRLFVLKLLIKRKCL